MIRDLPTLYCQQWCSNGQKLSFLLCRDVVIVFLFRAFPLSQFFLDQRFFCVGQVETDETENGNGKLKRKTETESGNGKAEIRKWSSQIVALRATFCACAIFLG